MKEAAFRVVYPFCLLASGQIEESKVPHHQDKAVVSQMRKQGEGLLVVKGTFARCDSFQKLLKRAGQ